MSDRVEVKCLSPGEWHLGWLKALVLFVLIPLGVVALRSHATPWAIAMVAALVTMAGVFVWPSKVTLLEDGLSITRYGFSRFIPYSKIVKTESLQRLGAGTSGRSRPARSWIVYTAIRLHLEDGSEVTIGTDRQDSELGDRVAPRVLTSGAYGDFGVFDRKGWQLRRDIDARVREARDEALPGTPIAASLMRGEKSIPEWLGAIEAAAPARGDAYRGSEGAREALWRVLEDEEAPREARAGAALALRSHLDAEGRERMRVVGGACDSPKLRVAIETALDEEAGEPRLLHALEQASLPRDE